MSPNNKKYDFSGKVALVTGSSSGIGAAIAIQFAEYGVRIAITGRNAENLQKIGKKIEQVYGGVKPLEIIGDLLDDLLPKRLIDETIGKFERLDFVVNNAGAQPSNGTLSSPNLLEEFDQVIKLNVRSVVELTQLAMSHLEKTQRNVINISSVVSIKVCSTSKALDMVTKTSALELGPKGIRVNSINPGPVVIPFGFPVGNDESVFIDFFDQMISNSLMKRVGQPEDIAIGY